MNRYVIPLVLVLLSAAIFIRFISPTFSDIQVGQAKDKELAELLAQVKTVQDRLLELKRTQESFPPGYDHALKTILPDTVDPTRLIIDVNGIAELRGLHLKSAQATINKSEGKGGYRKHSLTFTVTAPYDVFRSFLRDLESSLALRDVSMLGFSSNIQDNGVVKYKNPESAPHDYQVTITTYSL